MNKIKKFVQITGIIALFNLVLSIILVRMGYGLTGVALGTTIPFVIMEYFFLRHILTVLDVSWRTYANKIVLKTFPIAAVVAVIMYILLYVHTPSAVSFFWDIVGVGMYFLLGVAIYLILFYFYGLEEHEKKDIKEILSKIGAKVHKKPKADI
jgi:hypothetical protein